MAHRKDPCSSCPVLQAQEAQPTLRRGLDQDRHPGSGVRDQWAAWQDSAGLREGSRVLGQVLEVFLVAPVGLPGAPWEVLGVLWEGLLGVPWVDLRGVPWVHQGDPWVDLQA